jgi:imidazolonepropionase-like amidohydrolase
MMRAFAVLLLLAGSLHAQTDPPVVIRGGTIYTGHAGAEDPIENGVIILQNGKIVDVGASLEIPNPAEIIDATGMVIIPGMIDPASFLFLESSGAAGGGAPEFDVVDEIDPFQEGYREAVKAGITTVCVLPRASGTARGISTVLKLTSDRNRRILRKGAALHFSLSSGSSDTSDSFRRFAQVETIRRLFKGAKAYMESWNKYRKALAEYREKSKAQEKAKKAGDSKKAPEGKKAPPLKKPKKPPVNVSFQVIARTMNPKAPLPVRVEVHYPDSIEWILALAKEYKFRLILDQVTSGGEVAKKIAEAKVPVVVGPVFRYGFPGVDYLRHSPRTPFLLKKAGVSVSIGTFPVPNAGHEGFGASRFLPEAVAWASRGGGSSPDALRMITIDAANILGVGKRIGSLEKGKDADLVMLSGDLFDADRVVERTMINGRWEFVRTESP